MTPMKFMFYENHIDGDKTGQANHLLLFKYEFETRRRGETEDSHSVTFTGLLVRMRMVVKPMWMVMTVRFRLSGAVLARILSA